MNPAILFIAIGAFIAVNIHFGWNRTPKSNDELFADLIVYLITALAFVK